jgi:predicted transposase/invertase (TIGR01784 family)
MRPGIDPTVDYAFKWLFGREPNVGLLRHLLEAILQPPQVRIPELQLLNPFSEQDALEDKLSIVDVKARDQNGRLFHVEMQVLPDRAFRSRVLYYWAVLHQQQLHAVIRTNCCGQRFPSVSPTLYYFRKWPTTNWSLRY